MEEESFSHHLTPTAGDLILSAALLDSPPVIHTTHIDLSRNPSGRDGTNKSSGMFLIGAMRNEWRREQLVDADSPIGHWKLH